MSDVELSIPGYNLLRKDRPTTGCVCLYIRANFTYNPRHDLGKVNLEAVWLDLFLPKTRPILVGGLYHPQHQTDFIELFQEALTGLIVDREAIILGDVNLDLT